VPGTGTGSKSVSETATFPRRETLLVVILQSVFSSARTMQFFEKQKVETGEMLIQSNTAPSLSPRAVEFQAFTPTYRYSPVFLMNPVSLHILSISGCHHLVQGDDPDPIHHALSLPPHGQHPHVYR
jgi:hypothetical protein